MRLQKLGIGFAGWCVALASAQITATTPADSDFLSFSELVQLSTTAEPQGALAARLHHLLTTPVVLNHSMTSDSGPRKLVVSRLGPTVRVAFWNIERGLNFDLVRSALAGQVRAGDTEDSVRTQLEILQNAGIVVLNEVDLGMKRTEYRDVARDLAAALNMNYAFGPEFVEVDPLWDLGVQHVNVLDKATEQKLGEDLQVDQTRYRGLHGNAILSRYPIRRARMIRLPVCYDWYGKEVDAISRLEQGKRWGARALFRERINREVRHGNRMALIADLAVPGLPTGEVTVVSTHLENRCPPKCRRQQMEALLASLEDVRNPVILAGDLNTSGGDATPTSVRNEIMKRVTDSQFWVSQAISFATPVSFPRWILFPLRIFNNHLDPTAFHFPFIWQNHERGLFQRVGRFRFADGYAFDLRGRQERTLKRRARTLADSNQRGAKGFIPTYAFERDFGGFVGRYKLDWFFIKSFIQDARRDNQSYRFAPHFPITMREVNESIEGRISDHPPMTVDLPLQEPAIPIH